MRLPSYHIKPLLLFSLLLLLTALACQGLQRVDSLTPAPSSPATTPGQIAIVGADRNIYVVDPLSKERTAVTTDATPGTSDRNSHRYRYPTWSPDGQSLAFVSSSQQALFGNNTLYTASIAEQSLTPLYEDNTNAPFYLYWAPDSQSITFLAPHTPFTADLGLYLSIPATQETTLLDVSQPYYWHWAPTSDQIITHTGGRDGHIAFLPPQPNSTTTILPILPATFQAPSWSPDGSQILLAEQDKEDATQTALILTDAQGAPTETLLTLPNGPLSFNWSPNGDQIAYTYKSNATNAPLGHLHLINPLTQQSEQLTADLVFAFFWAPDGQKIAYFTLSDAPFGFERQAHYPKSPTQAKPFPQRGDIYLQLNLYDLTTNTTQQIVSFEPTTDYLNILPYFDQYQHSLRFWSPDSHYFLIAGYNQEIPTIWQISMSPPFTSPEPVSKGSIGVWSWQ